MALGINELENYIIVKITDSEMVATIKLKEQISDEPLLVEIVKQLLTVKNVVAGLDEKALTLFCKEPNNHVGKEIVVARGIPPLDGEDGYLEWAISEHTDKKPKELSDGRVDFYSVNQISNIKTGQLIARKVPGTDGKHGQTVTGKAVPGKRGKEAIIKPGKNVVLNDTKEKLYATIDGQVVLTDRNRINVFPVYEVNGDVDISVGNINFVGSVVIRGNVPDGFKIHADGEIKVYGNVEGAELLAGGDIFIKQGVVGHNKSFIKAGRNFEASFVLDGNVIANENVKVSQSIMHSKVSSGKTVTCKGIKGIIVGGKIQAGESVIASIIGNQMATATIIEAGISPDLRKELNELNKKKVELNESLNKVQKGISLLDKMQKEVGDLPPEKKKMQIHLINQQLVIEKEMRNLKMREDEIEELLKNYENTSIQVYKVVYPGTKLVIGKAVKYINTETQYMKFTLDEGEVIGTQL